MPRRRFFIPREQIRDGFAVLTPDQAHHLRDVLRLGGGDEVELIDGEGGGYHGTVVCRGTDVLVGPLQPFAPIDRVRVPLLLAAALLKADRYEWILQKGTELGVDTFIPLETRYTTAHLKSGRIHNRLERWQRIVREASKQCRRMTVPEILVPVSFQEMLAAPEWAGCTRYLLHEKASEPLTPLSMLGDRVLLCVGPEGGWDEQEAHSAAESGFFMVNMGARILRAETAAIAAVAVFRFLLDTRLR